MSALEATWEEQVAALDGVREELTTLLGFAPRPGGAFWGGCPACGSDLCCCIGAESISCDVCGLSLDLETALDLYDEATVLDGEGDRAAIRQRLAEQITATGRGYVPTATELASLPPWTGPRGLVVETPLVQPTDGGACIRLEDLDRMREIYASLVKDECLSQEQADDILHQHVVDTGGNQWVVELEVVGITEDELGRLRITRDPENAPASVEVPMEVAGRLVRAIRDGIQPPDALPAGWPGSAPPVYRPIAIASLDGCTITVVGDASGDVTITDELMAVNIVLPEESVRGVVQAIEQLIRRGGPIL